MPLTLYHATFGGWDPLILFPNRRYAQSSSCACFIRGFALGQCSFDDFHSLHPVKDCSEKRSGLTLSQRQITCLFTISPRLRICMSILRFSLTVQRVDHRVAQMGKSKAELMSFSYIHPLIINGSSHILRPGSAPPSLSTFRTYPLIFHNTNSKVNKDFMNSTAMQPCRPTYLTQRSRYTQRADIQALESAPQIETHNSPALPYVTIPALYAH